MCGIVGMAGDLTAGDRRVFRDLLDVCQLRGRDSTGVININRQKSYGYIKSVGPPSYLVDRRSYEQTIETGTHAAFIGHCRHKTSGAVTIANAHPFEFEDEGIIGVHNGTLQNYSRLEGYSFQKVDSEVLYEHLSKNGPEETFNQIDGAWACVWWNDQAETLNFIRNDKRPLWFCWSEDKRKMYWASSIWMLSAIEVDSRVNLWKGPKDDGVGKFISLPVDTLWSFTLEPSAKKGDPTVKMLPAKKIERKEPPKVETRPNFSSASSEGYLGETALSLWNKRTGRTHEWSAEEKKYVEKMTYQEWVTLYNAEKNKGGSVPNPFSNLDDQLPTHLRPKPETFEVIQGGKTSSTNSTQNSSTPSKNGSEPEKGPLLLSSGERNTDFQAPANSNNSQKTNRKKLSVKLPGSLTPTGEYTSKVSFRTIARLPFVTDMKTGQEYGEAVFEKNTNGICSYCEEPIGDLTEIHEFFGPNKFICVHCVEPPVRSVA